MDHSENTLRGIVKALTDVVAPAVDPTDALAQEQLRLSVDYLNFLRTRLDHLYDRERFELRHNIAMANTIQVALPGGAANGEKLAAALDHANRTYSATGLGINVLRAATADLGAAIRDVVRASANYDEPVRRQLNIAVLDATDDRVRLERAWYLPLGFDPSPAEVSSLEDLFREAGASQAAY